MDFVQSRQMLYIWCKKFEALSLQLNTREVDDSQISLDLLTEYRTKGKPILFIEGTKNSLDYQIYSKLFSEFCFVKPVPGHKLRSSSIQKKHNNLNKCMEIKHMELLIMIGWMKVVLKRQEEELFFHLMKWEMMLIIDEAVVKSCLPFDDDKRKNNEIEESSTEYH